MAMIVGAGQGAAMAAKPAPSLGSAEVVQKRSDGKVSRYLAPARTKAELQAQIKEQLRRAPGGVQIADNEVSYDNGRFIMTFARPGERTRDDASTLAVDCGGYRFCFFDGPNFTYPRGRLNDCGWQDLWTFNWGDRVESSAQVRPSPVFVLYIGHGAYPNHSDDDVYWFTDGNDREVATVPNPNAADHVNQNCPL
ncbi:hypothetical protein [Micromonospora sp. CPCC 206061]|uniref:hypothetical protein n=1 Tax=Micromonospora sp. CPCC 206061 TaxID=3122410 RepID=UPI002FF009A9